jgi:hypothetical protein
MAQADVRAITEIRSVSLEGLTISVATTNNEYVMALHDPRTDRVTMTKSSVEQVRKTAGTWVAQGGVDGSAIAMLVPDGIGEVRASTPAGDGQRPASNNVVLVRGDGPTRAEYDFGGQTHEATSPSSAQR